MTATPTRRPRWHQYSLRSLFVLTTLVAVAGSWYASRKRQVVLQRAAVEALEASDADVEYAHQRDAAGERISNAAPPGPAWLRSWLGDDFFMRANSVSFPPRNRTDKATEHLRELPHLEFLELLLQNVTDADLADLKGLGRLKHLDLSATQVTDAGLEHLKGLRQLRTLILRLCDGVTDDGLEHLKGLTELEALDLNGTDVTDAGLEHLTGLTNLKRLDLGETYATYGGIKRFQQVLPNCKVIVDDELGLSPFRRNR